jgi:hypothetical protein
MISNAQTYSIKALDGLTQQIHLVHELGDQKLVIFCLNDTLTIDDFINVSDVFILKGSFLKIQYAIRTGSEQSRERLLLLCVNKNKLCQSLHIQSLGKYDIDKVFDRKADSLKLFNEHRDYEIKISLIGTDKRNYKLKVDVHDAFISKVSSQANYDYNSKVILNFDPTQGVFYSNDEDLSQYFNIYNHKTQSDIKQYVMGVFPTIKLDKNCYYYIKGEWFEKGNDINLIKYTNR